MAKLYNLAKMTVSGTPGTGTITLGSAATVNGILYLSFAGAGVANGDVVDYAILDTNNSEIGTGTYTSAGTTLTRTVTKSTNANAAISATSAAIVSISPRAETLNDGTLLTTGTVPVARINGGTVNQTVQGDGTFVLQSRKLLNTLTASSSATLSDTTNLTATFSEYELAFENILPATNASSFELQVHSGGTFPATAYLTSGYGSRGGGVLATTVPTTYIPLSLVNDVANTGGGLCGWIRVFTPSASALHQWTGQTSCLNSAASVSTINVGGYWNSSAVIDGFQVLFSAGNIASGVVKVYGLN